MSSLQLIGKRLGSHPLRQVFVTEGTHKFKDDASFTGKAGQVFHDQRKSTLYTGVGAKPTLDTIEHAVHAAVTYAKTKKISEQLQLSSFPRRLEVFHAEDSSAVDILLPRKERTAPPRPVVARHIASTAVAAGYSYSEKQKPDLFVPSVAVNTTCASRPQYVEGLRLGEAVNDARTLGNLRPEVGSPQYYTAWIRRHIGSLPNVSVRHVLGKEELQRQGLHLLHAVGKAAVRPPSLVVVEYNGASKSVPSTALVGKGITFDCGGMNIKPYGSMESMHQDMMGAAAVMGAMKAIATMRLPVNVVGVCAFAENAIGPGAYLPSSIIKSLNGKTVEILNTDAEGRLVLADALTFVQRKAKLRAQPQVVVDVATLTGAIIIGLGNDRAGMFANDYHVAKTMLESSRHTNELVWPMPVGAEHTKAMQGGIADLINCGEGRVAGSCTAAAFLKQFIEPKTRWAHLDIAGAGMGKDKPTARQPAGVPGFGVKLLVDFVKNVSHK